MIPSIGLKSVEVLRDGAAAQYGSDAIAGVMNFRMKDDSEGGSVMVQYGEFFEGEESMKVGANAGFALGSEGFLNLTAEWYDNDAHDRAIQRPDAQSIVDAGGQGVGYGYNELDYTLNNTTNSSIGLGSDGEPLQMKFDPGDYGQEEVTVNADFSKSLTDNLHLGFGGEWREETYTITAGEPNSYLSPGSSGMEGRPPSVAGDFDRDNWAIYGDLEHDITDNWLMQYALRYEDFSDFGDTTNGKIATRYSITDAFTIRGAVSTGFHAPTPGQANNETTITTFDGTSGEQTEERLIKPTDPLAVDYGGKELTEEKSTNYSIGFTSDIGDSTNLTLDVYLIEVDDRIYRAGDILTAGGDTISFYTNAMDVEHQGVDLVLTSFVDWSSGVDTTFTFAFNYNEIEVVNQSQVNGVNPVSESLVEDIENNYPEERFVFTANTRFEQDWWFMFRANWWGSHYDERGTIDGDFGERSKELDPLLYVDLELGWDVTENWNVTLGGSNVFDEYPDKIKSGGQYDNRISVGLEYPRRTVTGYEGGSWYLRTSYNF